MQQQMTKQQGYTSLTLVETFKKLIGKEDFPAEIIFHKDMTVTLRMEVNRHYFSYQINADGSLEKFLVEKMIFKT